VHPRSHFFWGAEVKSCRLTTPQRAALFHPLAYFGPHKQSYFVANSLRGNWILPSASPVVDRAALDMESRSDSVRGFVRLFDSNSGYNNFAG
jgi:hypothetical protein